MSQPRRRRRRGRKRGSGNPASGGNAAPREEAQQPAPTQDSGGPRSRNRRRGRKRTGGGNGNSPRSSEDLVRALPKERPATLTAPPDGQTLEVLIGELQSTWGVPQYPQEFRITIKVAEKNEQRQQQPVAADASRPAPNPEGDNGAPKREKAPAAPRIASGPGDPSARSSAPRKRRRSRRRRGGRGGGPSANGGSAGPGGPPSGGGGD